MPPRRASRFARARSLCLIDRAERAATWSHGKPVGVAPLPGLGPRLRADPQRMDAGLAAERTELSSPRGGLAGRDQRPARRHAARGGARLRQVPGQPRELQSPSRRAGLSHAAGPHVPDGAGFARPDSRPRMSTRGSGRTRSAGPCWPSESCPACASPAPTAT